jgi:hypothetical protein
MFSHVRELVLLCAVLPSNIRVAKNGVPYSVTAFGAKPFGFGDRTIKRITTCCDISSTALQGLVQANIPTDMIPPYK